MCKEGELKSTRALYHNIGKYIALNTISEQQEREIIQGAMEVRAIRILETIREMLEDDTHSAPECLARINALTMLFFQELEVKIDRHSELD